MTSTRESSMRGPIVCAAIFFGVVGTAIYQDMNPDPINKDKTIEVLEKKGYSNVVPIAEYGHLGTPGCTTNMRSTAEREGIERNVLLCESRGVYRAFEI